MHLVKHWLLLIILSLSIQSLAFAEDKTDAPSTSVEQWDMQSLPADWWRLLSNKDTNLLTATLSQLQNKLLAVRASLTTEQQNDTTNAIQSIASSAKAYLDLSSKSGQVSAKPMVTDDSYPLAVWLDAMRDLRKANNDNTVLADRIAQSNEQLAAIAKDADDAAAAYFSASTDARAFQSIDMIERRLAWLVANESLRLQRVNGEGAQALLVQVDTRWRLATEHLVIGDKDIKSVQAQLDTDHRWLDKSTDLLRNAQADAVLVWGDDEDSRAKAELQQVAVLQASVVNALAKAKNQWNARLLAYLHARSDKQFNWDADLRALIPAWQAEAGQLEQQRKEWRQQLDSHREQVQSALLLLVESPPEGMNSRQLSQIKQAYQQAIKNLADSQAGLKSLRAQLDDSATLAELEDKLLLLHDGVWGSRWHSGSQVLITVSQDVWAMMSSTLFKVGDTPVTLLGIIRVFLFITIAWWLSFWLRKGLVRVAKSNGKIAPHTAYTLGRLIHYVMMIVGIVLALSSVGIDFSNVAWIAGALSVGIGFGLQDVVKNFVSGLIVMFEKTLKVGDYIELPSGIAGNVKEISLRSTLITTADNLEVVIPNAEFTSGRVVNWTLSDLYRRVHIPFNVSLGSDKKAVVDAVLAAANTVPYTIHESQRKPQVVLGSLDGKMAFELLVWIKQGAVKHSYGVKPSYLWQIETALREKGIELV